MDSRIETTTTRAGRGTRRIVLIVLVPFGLGFYLSYLYRTVNAVISPQLVAEMGLGPADLGLLTSIYFITFASIQIPLGMLLDRYGPRRVQVALLLVAAAGGAVFALGQSFAMLTFGRALIGFGVAGCMVAGFKANATWFPPERLPLVNNVVAAFGSFGALSATTPVEALLQVTGWREIFIGLALLTVALALATRLVVPEKADAAVETASWRISLRAFPAIFANAYFLRLAALFVACNGTFLAYQTLWAAPWLRDVAGYGRQAVADGLFLLQLGMFVGMLAIGVLADRLQRTRFSPLRLYGIGTAVYIAVQLALALGATWPAGALWAAFGFFGTSTFLCFAIFTRLYPANMTGRVVSASNLMIFVLAFAFQWGIGAIIGLFPETAAGGYAPSAHRAAFLTVIAIEVAAYAYFVWPRKAARLDNAAVAPPNPAP